MHLEEQRLGDYVDEALDASARNEVERHLDACESCRRLVEDLREIRRTAGSLDLREPPARAWPRIERAVRLETENRIATTGGVEIRRHWRSWTWLAAAAVLVLATVIGLRGLRDLRYGALQSQSPATGARRGEPAAATAPSEAAQSVEAELREAEAHYDRAIKGLEQIASAEKGAFDPATAAALQKNLAVIDQAINESRAALRAQPASEPARDSLMENFKSKLALLQDTVALINEMRKGNEAGASRVVSGLKQKGD